MVDPQRQYALEWAVKSLPVDAPATQIVASATAFLDFLEAKPGQPTPHANDGPATAEDQGTDVVVTMTVPKDVFNHRYIIESGLARMGCKFKSWRFDHP